MPRNLLEVAEREKDIRYSSRTRLNTDYACRLREAQGRRRRLAREAAAGAAHDPDAGAVRGLRSEDAVTSCT